MNPLVALFFLALNWVLNFFAPKPEEQAGSRDVSIPNSNQGDVFPKLFGCRFDNGMKLAWWGDLDVRPIRKSGGKK